MRNNPLVVDDGLLSYLDSRPRAEIGTRPEEVLLDKRYRGRGRCKKIKSLIDFAVLPDYALSGLTGRPNLPHISLCTASTFMQ